MTADTAVNQQMDTAVPTNQEFSNPDPTPPIVEASANKYLSSLKEATATDDANAAADPPSGFEPTTMRTPKAVSTFNNHSPWTGQFFGGANFQALGPTASTSSLLVGRAMFESPDPSAYASAAIESSSSVAINNDYNGRYRPTIPSIVPVAFSSLDGGNADLPPTGTTPSLPSPLNSRMLVGIGRHCATPSGPGFGFGLFGYANNDYNYPLTTSSLKSDLDETFTASSYVVNSDEQQGDGMAAHHPGAPAHSGAAASFLTVASINEQNAQKKLPSPRRFDNYGEQIKNDESCCY
jgi:hypothetical protein